MADEKIENPVTLTPQPRSDMMNINWKNILNAANIVALLALAWSIYTGVKSEKDTQNLLAAAQEHLRQAVKTGEQTQKIMLALDKQVEISLQSVYLLRAPVFYESAQLHVLDGNINGALKILDDLDKFYPRYRSAWDMSQDIKMVQKKNLLAEEAARELFTKWMVDKNRQISASFREAGNKKFKTNYQKLCY